MQENVRTGLDLSNRSRTTFAKTVQSNNASRQEYVNSFPANIQKIYILGTIYQSTTAPFISPMAKKNTSAPAAKGDIDFEKELWDVANELRGAVAENQYKDYVLPLLFVKHLSARFAVEED